MAQVMRRFKKIIGFSDFFAKPTKNNKIRIKIVQVLGVTLLVGTLTFVSAYLARDYTRLLSNREEYRYSIAELQLERDNLHRDKQNLKQKVRGLKTEKARAKEYKKSVEERLKKLTEVLHTAKNLGMFHEVEQVALTVTDKNNVGGLGGFETTCAVAGKSGCLKEVSNWDYKSEKAVLKFPNEDGSSSSVELLEKYVKAIRSIPLAHPAIGKITSPFGARKSPFGNTWKIHHGIDISLKSGTPVRVTADGEVIEAKYNRDYGYYIDVRHSKHVTTRYAHLSKTLVKKGDFVNVQSVIALSGSTGRSTGPHLHYEVRVDNVSKNPMPLFSLGEELVSALESDKEIKA